MITRSLADLAAAIGQSAELSLIVKATLALASGLAVAGLAPRVRSSVRHLVLAVTLGSLLALPVAAMLTTPLVIEVPVAPRSEDASVMMIGSSGAAGVAMAPSTRAATGTTNALPAVTRPALLRAAWLVGVLLLLGSLATSLWRLSRLRRNGMPWLDAPGFVRQFAERSNTRRHLDVLLHEDVAVPLTCGVLRPAIVLPADARGWSDADIRRALVHEAEHVHRADWLVQVAARATCAVYWFHPLAWIALRKLCLEAERACDDAVVRGTERTEYAEQLVSLAERLKAGSKPPILAMASRSDLASRVTSLLDATRRRGRAGVLATTTTIGAAAIIVLAMAPVRAVGAPTPGTLEPLEGAPATTAQTERRASRADRDLLRAAGRGDTERIAALLDAGANINVAIDGDGTPLIVAARQGRLPAVRLLLDRGADPNLGVSGDGNPIIMAAREGHADIVELLLARGASIDQVVDGDENALIQASGEGHLGVVKLLVARGASVNARSWAESAYDRPSGEWRTPLRMARKGRHDAVVAFLRSVGARE